MIKENPKSSLVDQKGSKFQNCPFRNQKLHKWRLVGRKKLKAIQRGLESP